MTPGRDEFCSVQAVAPRVVQVQAKDLNPDPSVTVNACDQVVPAPTEFEIRDRGHYPRPFDLNRNRDDREVECYSDCEQDNGLIRNGTAVSYLGSTCHLFVRAGCCPNENTTADLFQVIQSGLGAFRQLLEDTGRAAGLRGLTRAFLGYASPGDRLTCQDNHKGRECQQVFIGDISLDFRESGKGPIAGPSIPTQVIRVSPGENIDFVLHNNGCYGVTQLQVLQREIPGRIVRSYREVPFQDVRLPQISPLATDRRSHSTDPLLRDAPIFGKFRGFSAPGLTDVTPTAFGFFSGEVKELPHFFSDGTLDSANPCEHYRYFCDVALQYRVPLTASVGTRDKYAFSSDGCAVAVIFEVVGTPDPSPSPSDSPTVSPTATPTETPTGSPTPTDLIQVGQALTGDHTVGVSPCPQLVGSLAIGNRTGDSLSIQVSVDALAVDLEQPTNFTLPGNGATLRDVFFNCGTQQSFSGVITIRATRASDGAVEVETVPVTMNIH